MISGDIQVNKVHHTSINVTEIVREAFDMIPCAAQRLTKWMSDLRTVKITQDQGVSFLVEAVERKALPIFDLMDARNSFLTAYNNENNQIQYGKTIWAAYQAVTETWKKRLLSNNQTYSIKLNQLVSDRVGMTLK
jgi:hypothetical protein